MGARVQFRGLPRKDAGETVLPCLPCTSKIVASKTHLLCAAFRTTNASEADDPAEIEASFPPVHALLFLA